MGFLYLSEIELKTPFLLSGPISNSAFSAFSGTFDNVNVMIAKKLHYFFLISNDFLDIF